MKTFHLSLITEIVSNTFPNKWWETYPFESNTNNKPLLKKLSLDISNVLEDVFDNLNKSVLLGEYVHKHFLIELNKIKESINSIQPYFSYDESEKSLFLQDRTRDLIENNFIKSIEVSLRIYHSLHIDVKNRYQVDNKNFKIKEDSITLDALKNNSFNTAVKDHLSFFYANIFIASADHFLLPDSDYLSNLIEIIKDDKLYKNKYYLILKDKCNFLINKLILREQHSLRAPVYIINNNNEERYNHKKHYSSELLNDWRRYIITHYQLTTDWESEIAIDYDETKNKPLQDNSFKELHRKIKFFKDVEPSIENLIRIREEFEKKTP